MSSKRRRRKSSGDLAPASAEGGEEERGRSAAERGEVRSRGVGRRLGLLSMAEVAGMGDGGHRRRLGWERRDRADGKDRTKSFPPAVRWNGFPRGINPAMGRTHGSMTARLPNSGRDDSYGRAICGRRRSHHPRRRRTPVGRSCGRSGSVRPWTPTPGRV
jgi:hypothetical protein